ncbi:hypothetical protein FGIG_03028 [Fasciola gigantica]|uniref:Uncharacterized protein n=1 Tax=Fasciola gigantica TaxID=46835 RepID=A0A504YXQ2_FASGI|nr:hypothetical protein FGIG_03028 [Fasciola gigantica]
MEDEEPREDNCERPSEVNREEDEDIRVMAELNNPRIYRDVKHILRQEQRVKLAISRNKSLPFPCKCRQLCEFGPLLKILYRAFETLYEEYEMLHYEYTTLFRMTDFTVSGTNIYLNDSGEEIGATEITMPSERINLIDFARDADMREERKQAVASEDVWRKTYELHMECVRLYMIQVAKPEQDRFMEWLYSHIWAQAKCICYHCDYRDALVAYRKAILNLHLEYLTVYAQYFALLTSPRAQENRMLTKALGMNAGDAMIVKLCLT